MIESILGVILLWCIIYAAYAVVCLAVCAYAYAWSWVEMLCANIQTRVLKLLS